MSKMTDKDNLLIWLSRDQINLIQAALVEKVENSVYFDEIVEALGVHNYIVEELEKSEKENTL